MSKIILIACALLTVSVSVINSQPSDIMEIAEWTRKIIVSYVDSQKVERVFDDKIDWYPERNLAVYAFKMDVSVRRKDGSIYVLINS